MYCLYPLISLDHKWDCLNVYWDNPYWKGVLILILSVGSKVSGQKGAETFTPKSAPLGHKSGMFCKQKKRNIYGISTHFPSFLQNWFDCKTILKLRDPTKGFSGGSACKESVCIVGDLSFIPWLQRSPWEGKGTSTPVFWPWEFHELYSPWGCKALDTTDFHFNHPVFRIFQGYCGN